jgi:hypothetical protein
VTSQATTTATSSQASDETAVLAAEASLANAEDSETSSAGNRTATTGQLDGGVTATAVSRAVGAAPSSALAALSTLEVKGRAPMTGYP